MTWIWYLLLTLPGMSVRPVRPLHPVISPITFVDSTARGPQNTQDPREILVLWRRGTRTEDQQQVLQDLGQVVATGRYAPTSVLRVRPTLHPQAVLESLRQNPHVRAADFNYHRRLLWEPNDPLYPLQWALHPGVLNLPSAWDTIQGGSNTVRVGILDSGVAFEDFPIPTYEQAEVASADGWYHQAPDLAETQFAPGYDAVHQDDHPNDQHGHGTHVAGIIAQSTNNAYGTAGIAFDVTLVPIQVANYQGSVHDDWLVDGLAYALQAGVHILNMSFGGPDSSSVVHAALQQADSAGILLVAAAGNSGAPPVLYPAAYPEVIAVGAVRQNLERASYSSYGDALDLVAPGGYWQDSIPGILQQTYAPVSDSVAHVDTFAFVYKSGTSMAAPQVAGVAALLMSAGASAAQARQALFATAHDLGPPGWDPEYGHGLVDAAAALAYVLGDTGTPSTLDTLRNLYNGNIVYTDDPQFQVLYEATRFRPQSPCSLRTLRVAFYNYDTLQTHTKACTLFVWEDAGGQPGSRLATIPASITLGPDSLGWLEVSVESLQIALEVPFWIGHIETSPGPPTSILDDQPDGTNEYRFPQDPQWYLDPYDYYQEAVVRYYALNDSTPPEFTVRLLPNPYLPRQLDIWVVSSEPLFGGDLPPESSAVLTPDSTRYPLVFHDVDRQTYRADYVVVDSGTHLLWIKGRDPAGNWAEVTLEFSTAFAGPQATVLRSPNGRLRVYIPPQAISEPRVVLCVQTAEASFDLRGRVQGPVLYRYQSPVPLQPWVWVGNPMKAVEHFTYEHGEIRFRWPTLVPVVFSSPLTGPVVLPARNPARPGDPLRVIGGTAPVRAITLFRVDGRRWGTLQVQPGVEPRLPLSLPAGVYFLRAEPGGKDLQRLVVVR